MQIYMKNGKALYVNGYLAPKASGETWVLNNEIPVPEPLLFGEVSQIVYNAPKFSWGGTDTATSIHMEEDGSSYHLLYGTTSVAGTSTTGSNDTWYMDRFYNTLTFTSSPTGNLLEWLQQNGTKQ